MEKLHDRGTDVPGLIPWDQRSTLQEGDQLHVLGSEKVAHNIQIIVPRKPIFRTVFVSLLLFFKKET
jgi:hypothetical protein